MPLYGGGKMEFRTGCIINKEFEKTNFDYNTIKSLVSMANVIPDEYIIPNYKILNQGQVGSCVAHALVQNRLLKENEQLQEDKNYSTNWIYHNRKVTDWQGEGMYTEEALSNLISDGVTYYEDMIGNTKYSEKPSNFEESKLNLLPKAQRHKITAYYQIKTDDVLQKIQDIKTAIVTTGAVIVTVEVFGSFYEDGNNGGTIRNFKIGEQYYGSHAMVIIGWNRKNEWIVANSWGENWGDKGLCYISMLSNIFRQYFVVVDNYVEKELGNLKYALVLKDSMGKADNYLDMCKVLFGDLNFKFLNIGNNRYVSAYDYYDDIDSARNKRNSTSLKDILCIIPFSVLTKYVCIDYAFTNEVSLDFIISDFIPETDFEKRFELKKIKHENYFFMSLKSFTNDLDLENFINSADEAYKNSLIIKQV